jgi:hypothetical protein
MRDEIEKKTNLQKIKKMRTKFKIKSNDRNGIKNKN